MKNVLLKDKKKISRILTIGICLSMLTGCGSSALETNSDEEITLIEPASGIPSYVAADYRTLYDVDVYSAILNPGVTEYAYESSQSFGGYGHVIGDEVSAGDCIIYGSTEDIDERIEELNKTIEEAEKSYNTKLSDLKYDLQQSRKSESEKGTLSNSFDSDYVPLYIQGDYKRAALASKRIEEQILETKEQYSAQKAHYDRLMNILLSEKGDVQVSSDTSGVVVAEGEYQIGESISQGKRVCAVTTPGVYKFDTEFVNAGILRKAEDIYAVVNGKRYEVTPVIIEGKEYEQLTKANGSVYSSFILEEDCGLEYGTYGVIVIENKVHKDVLAVPNDAIHRDGGNAFVNVYENGTITKTEVKAGMKDGMYTEILSGIEANTLVLSDGTPTDTKSTKTISYGSVSADFSETGYLYCPSMSWVSNPSKNGSVYLKEFLVDEYEQVEKGQVVAKLEVVPDSVNIQRLKRQIQRATERKAVLEDEAAHDYSTEVNIERVRSIRSYAETIEKTQKELDEIEKYSGEVELVSSFTGMVVRRADLKAGDLLYYKQPLVMLCDYSECFIIVEDKEARLGYGNAVTVSFNGLDSSKQYLDGTVVTANKTALSSDLLSEYAMIALSDEDMQNLITVGSAHGDSGWYRTRFTVECKVRSEDNVLTVPKNVVKESGGSTYVRVKTEDGVKYVSFVAGGSDLTNYWVVEGLSEGMQVCSD